jgi:hypothetical protein
MDTIKRNQNRVGNITSSEIVALTTNNKQKQPFGAAGLTYIEECNMERRLGRSITDEVKARATSWGNLVEKRVFDLLGMDYQLASDETICHPLFPYWWGSPDAIKNHGEKTVADVKCPLTLKSFCQLVDPYIENGIVVHKGCTIEALRANHKDGEKFYWQLISNSCITGALWGELIIYVPYQHELDEIREIASSAPEGVQSKFAWVNYASDDELPYLIEGKHYQNINIIRFEIPQADKDFLTERVGLAARQLEPITNPFHA